jgi:hypothetical protein
MMRRLIAAALLLYPRAVRASHGEELESLVEELIERDGASRPVVITRLAADGLLQRLTGRTTAWVVAVTLALTSFGGLAVSDFAAASARQALPAGARTPAHTLPVARTPSVARTHLHAKPHRISRRPAQVIAP